jgi:hypothetical protein
LFPLYHFASVLCFSFREHLARNQVIRDQRKAVQQERYQALLKDLDAEKDVWITRAQIETKITEDLFSSQATTGLVTRHSEHWRWQMVPMNIQRMMSPECRVESSGSHLTDRLAQRGQVRSMKKLIVQDILEPMIGTGSDRARYKELVDKFSKQFETMGAFNYVDDYYAEVTKCRLALLLRFMIHSFVDDVWYNTLDQISCTVLPTPILII